MKTFFLKRDIEGFSLVEILVVLGLFSSISTLSLGALFNAQAINRRLQETQSILDNVNLSTQTITREIRFGTEFYATTTLQLQDDPAPTFRRNCTYALNANTPCTILMFKPSDAVDARDRIAFYLLSGVLYKTTYPFGGSSSTEQMTSNDVTISSLFFYVEGAQTSDGSNDESDATDFKQPLITFLLSGSTNSASGRVASTTFNFETNISPRELDSI